jgi:hypothetical protein
MQGNSIDNCDYLKFVITDSGNYCDHVPRAPRNLDKSLVLCVNFWKTCGCCMRLAAKLVNSAF